MKHEEYRRAIARLGDGATITVRYTAMIANRSVTGRYRPSPANDPDCLYVNADGRLLQIMYHRIVSIEVAERRAA